MKYCSKCGKEIMDDAIICIHCGCSTGGNSNNKAININDAPSIGFGFLGFFFPLIGLILYLVNKDNYPLKAKSAGKGALIGVILNAVVIILYIIMIGVLFNSLGYYL